MVHPGSVQLMTTEAWFVKVPASEVNTGGTALTMMGESAHCVEPAASENVPGSHFMHEAAFTFSPYFPGGHCSHMHDVAPTSDPYFLVAHCLHVIVTSGDWSPRHLKNKPPPMGALIVS